MTVTKVFHDRVLTRKLLDEKEDTGAGSTFLKLSGASSFTLKGEADDALDADVDVEFTNVEDPTDQDWEVGGNIVLSAAGSPFRDSGSFASSDSATYKYVRGNVNSISGTNAKVTLVMGAEKRHS